MLDDGCESDLLAATRRDEHLWRRRHDDGRKRTVRYRSTVRVGSRPRTGRYALVTRYRLVPGSNYDAGTEWKTGSLTVEHGWRSGSLVSHSGDVVPAAGGDADSNLYPRVDRSTRRSRWDLTFDPATVNSGTPRVATVVDRKRVAATGDTLADAAFGGGFTEGSLGASERDLATARLLIGGDE
jgi:hypothetical protein